MLYAQNAKTMIRNALWLTVMTWVLGLIVFLLTLAPAGAILYAMPGNLAGWAFVLAIVFAWACISAFVEPFVIAALMQVYFKTIEGQVPDPEWDRRLAETSQAVPRTQGQGACLGRRFALGRQHLPTAEAC